MGTPIHILFKIIFVSQHLSVTIMKTFPNSCHNRNAWIFTINGWEKMGKWSNTLKK